MDAGYTGNDNTLWITVKDAADAADTGATVTAVITDEDGGTTESGLTLAYTSARARYEVRPDEDQWTAGRYYTATISVTATDGTEGSIRVPFLARARVA